MEDHRWDVRVRSTGQGTVSVFARKHRLEIGAPVEFDDEGPGITALECGVGALGAELVGGLERIARRRRIALDHVEALVQWGLNDALAAMGVVGAKGHAGIEWIQVKVYVSSGEDSSVLERAWEEVLEVSPLLRTFRAAAKVDVSLQFA